MWTFAGKTAASSPRSHQRANRRVDGGTTPRPPTISATPLQATASFGEIGT
jgi:hypothetical protein